MICYKLKTTGGDCFNNVAQEAKEIAMEKKWRVEFDFNEVSCFVDSSTNLEWLYRDYSNSWTMGWKKVGPDCLAVYDKKTQEKFNRLTKIEQEQLAKEDLEYRNKEKKEREAFELKVKGIEIELKDKEGWEKSRQVNKDPYGSCGLDYAEGWAKLMQIEIENGKTLIDCAERTSYELGFLGITGFMYGCAVSILSQTWKHGEELRKWHNKDYGHVGDGVVNPALLSISSK